MLTDKVLRDALKVEGFLRLTYRKITAKNGVEMETAGTFGLYEL